MRTTAIGINSQMRVIDALLVIEVVVVGAGCLWLHQHFLHVKMRCAEVLCCLLS